jgi:hypothetical protein
MVLSRKPPTDWVVPFSAPPKSTTEPPWLKATEASRPEPTTGTKSKPQVTTESTTLSLGGWRMPVKLTVPPATVTSARSTSPMKGQST